MNCPYCGAEMENGVVQSAREMFWGREKHKFMFSATREDEFTLAHGWNGSAIEAFCCRKCKKIIIDYK